jgi:hypothetical protein
VVRPRAGEDAPVAHDVEHYIKQTRRQAINHIVFGHHVAVNIARETRRNFQKEARILRPDGTIAFVEPFSVGAPAREASCKALDDQVRAQCVKFCTLQQTKHEGRKERKLKEKPAVTKAAAVAAAAAQQRRWRQQTLRTGSPNSR